MDISCVGSASPENDDCQFWNGNAKKDEIFDVSYLMGLAGLILTISLQMYGLR